MKSYVILAVAGIVFLYVLSALFSPPHVSIGEIWKYEGKEVTIQGKIVNRFGNLFEIKENGYTIMTYIWSKNCTYGDIVEITGMVEERNGNIILYSHDVKIISKWNSRIVSLPYLAENIQEFEGCNVKVEGYVYSVSSEYFYLTDEKGEYRIKVYYDYEGMKYERVVVNGLLKFNPKRMEFYIEGLDVE